MKQKMKIGTKCTACGHEGKLFIEESCFNGPLAMWLGALKQAVRRDALEQAVSAIARNCKGSKFYEGPCTACKNICKVVSELISAEGEGEK